MHVAVEPLDASPSRLELSLRLLKPVLEGRSYLLQATLLHRTFAHLLHNLFELQQVGLVQFLQFLLLSQLVGKPILQPPHPLLQIFPPTQPLLLTVEARLVESGARPVATVTLEVGGPRREGVRVAESRRQDRLFGGTSSFWLSGVPLRTDVDLPDVVGLRVSPGLSGRGLVARSVGVDSAHGSRCLRCEIK